MSEPISPFSPTVISTARTRAGTLPSRFPSNASRESSHYRNRSVPKELDQIRAYVDATNEHIHHIEDIVEPSAAEQIVEIKRGLRDAHRGLEQLQAQFSEVSEITRDVWQTYRRLRDLEEGLRVGGTIPTSNRNSAQNIAVPDIISRELDAPQPRVVRIEPAVVTESVVGDDNAEALGIVKEEDEEEAERGIAGDENWTVLEGGQEASELELREEGEEYVTPAAWISPAKSKSKSKSTVAEESNDPIILPPRRISIAGPSKGEGRTGEHLVPPRRLPSTASRSTQRTASGKHRRVGVEGSTKTKLDPRVKTMRGSISRKRPKTRQEVIASVAEEENRSGIGIIDPNRRREGSRDGWQITQAVMTADSDPTLCVPHLAYMKIHEVRDLKNWLHKHKYLRQSKRISKTEKLLHLLTVLQLGCRYESVAVLFSRTPKEVLFSCREAFEGLLELHSETMLPPINLLEKYIYPYLWHIVDNYDIMDEDSDEQHYHPWEKEDICKVLVTLNMYIGRYRSQGHVALEGEFLDWGRYIQVDHNASEDVAGWIERLQAPVREAATQEEVIGEAEEPPEREQEPRQEPRQEEQPGNFHTQQQGSRSPQREGLMESTIRLVRGDD